MSGVSNHTDDGFQNDENLYRVLAESSQDIIFLIDRENCVRYVNSSAALFFGAPKKEIEGKHLKELFAPAAHELQSRALQHVFQSGEPFYAEENSSFSDREIWIETRLMPIKARDGSVDYVMGVSRDITGRKQTELALRESEATARTLLDIPIAAALLIDRHGVCLDVNETMAKRFGWKSTDIIGKPVWDLFPSEVSRSRKAHFEDVLRTKKQVRFEDERQGIWNDITATPVLDSDGSVSKVVVFGFDITDRKKAEEELKKYRDHLEELVAERTKELSVLHDQLRQSQKLEAIGILAGGIAHEFSNVLATMKGSMYLMEKKLPKDSPVMKYVGQVLASINKANTLSQGLLAFSRKQTISLRPVYFNRVIQKTAGLLSRFIGEHIELALVLTEGNPVVMADINQIEQVLVNLATNARDAMPDGGKLTLKTDIMTMTDDFRKERGYGAPGEYAVLTVSDTGTGIGEEIREKIFEPFFTTKVVGKGSGLGLAVTYGIVKQHNGFIDAESVPGEGTTFKIYIPTVYAEVLHPKSKDALFPGGGEETILLAEDDTDMLATMAEMLEMSGYNVLKAGDGEQAVRVFTENKDKVKLVFLDVRMPRKNGKAVYDDIKKISPEAKFLFTSGYTEDIIDSHGISQEGLDFISKAELPDEILRKIRELLDR